MKPFLFVAIFLVLTAAFYFYGRATTTVVTIPIPPAPASTASASVTPVSKAPDTLLTEDNPAPAPKGTGSLKGVAKYDGDPPALMMLDIPAADHEKCANKKVDDESLVVDKATKGLKWVIVRIMDIKPAGDPPLPAGGYTMTQKGCTFSPHIGIVAPNHDLMILNPEKITHNIHSLPFDSENKPVNEATSTDFKYKAAWLKDPDLIKLNCDIHGWMKGFILCHDPRYCAVTAADGTFEIKDIPAGKYKINVWHEKFGNYMKKETIDIVINPGAATDLGEMKFTPKK